MKRASVTIYFDNVDGPHRLNNAGAKLASKLRDAIKKVQDLNAYQLASLNNRGVVENECFWPDKDGPTPGSILFECPAPGSKP